MGEFAVSDVGQHRQRSSALKRANRVRYARASMKRLICNGEMPASKVIRDCPWEAYKMPVSEVLMSQKRWGIMRCRRVLVPIGIPENKTVGSLTDRQRDALVAVLGGADEEEPGSRPARRAPARALQVV